MKRPFLVGITGGIGAGKSTVAKIFTHLGVLHYNSDSRAKQLMIESENIKSGLRVLFGDESIENGQLNRKWIAEKSFNEPKLLNQLNGLVHPVVAKDFEEFVSTHSSEKYILKETALLIETGLYKKLDYIILVSASQDIRIKRVLARDPQRTQEDVEAIISKQLPEKDKESLADVILRNDDSQLIIPQVLKLHEQFSSSQIPS